MKTKINLFILMLLYYSSFAQTTYKKIFFGDNGVIEIPSNWKIYDQEWNDNITSKAGFKDSKKKTILRANDYDVSTIYIKLSTKVLGQALPEADLKGADFLEALNDDLASIKAQVMNDSNKELINSEAARHEKFGSALGGYITYTYKEKSTGETRKSIIYTMIKGQNFYNLTISWNVSNQLKCRTILERIKATITFSS